MAQMQNRNNPNPQQQQVYPQKTANPVPKPPPTPVQLPEEPAAKEEPVEEKPKALPGDDPRQPIDMYQWFSPARAQGMTESHFTLGMRLNRGGGPGVTGVVERITLLPSGLVRVCLTGGTIMVSGGYGVVATGMPGGAK